MIKNRHIDAVCRVVVAAALVITLLFVNGEKLGLNKSEVSLGYESRLFDISRVHTLDIVMDESSWEALLENAEDEEYSACTAVIDGEKYGSVAIRAKGNTSLSSVKSYGNNRYSFKLEFDHYNSGGSYYGLDKLVLNNCIQDNTYMKDFLTYQMMLSQNVAAPLCSFIYITVNGEDWGLYLGVESVEDSFLKRNYSSESGDLYKPDSLGMGGGRGNGKDFNMDDFAVNTETSGQDTSENTAQRPGGFPGMPGDSSAPPDRPANAPDGMTGASESSTEASDGSADTSNGIPSRGQFAPGNFGGGMGGGIGSGDVSLIYSDDDYDSYSNIFSSAKTAVTDADSDRLIASLRQLNENENIAQVVDVESVINYFAVHNFVVNFDSYTGSMIHNYYLYEDGGVMSMIPWDYNLAFGTFSAGGSSDASSAVNYPIDTPVSGGEVSSRPMLAWIFESDEYTQAYHDALSGFIEQFFTGGEFERLFDSTVALISPYVEKDPTAFCEYEEFTAGCDTLKQFCLLRASSVEGQLNGTIPSDSQSRSEDSAALIDASSINLSDMGSMGGDKMQRDENNSTPGDSTETPSAPSGSSGETPSAPSGDSGEMPSAPSGNSGEMPSVPSGSSGVMPSNPFGDRGTDTQGGNTSAASQTDNRASSLPAICVSAVMLAAGLLFATLYKKRRTHCRKVNKELK